MFQRVKFRQTTCRDTSNTLRHHHPTMASRTATTAAARTLARGRSAKERCAGVQQRRPPGSPPGRAPGSHSDADRAYSLQLAESDWLTTQRPEQQPRRGVKTLDFAGTKETVYERSDWPVPKLQEYFKNDTLALIGYGSQGELLHFRLSPPTFFTAGWGLSGGPTMQARES